MVITTPQAQSLAKIARDHDGEFCRIQQGSYSNWIDVEFNFPVCYRIMSDGQIIHDYAKLPDSVKPFMFRG